MKVPIILLCSISLAIALESNKTGIKPPESKCEDTLRVIKRNVGNDFAIYTSCTLPATNLKTCNKDDKEIKASCERSLLIQPYKLWYDRLLRPWARKATVERAQTIVKSDGSFFFIQLSQPIFFELRAETKKTAQQCKDNYEEMKEGEVCWTF